MQARLKVLVVDDSAFYRHRIGEMLEVAPDLEIAGYAMNGEEAVNLAQQLHPDVITMDVQMPVLDGITAVRHIMARSPTRILMFSALTKAGARETLDALESGAMDFLPKTPDGLKSGESAEVFGEQLRQRVRAVGHGRLPPKSATNTRLGASRLPVGYRQETGPVDMIAIGASTGGPVALQNILTRLPRNFPIPLVVAVHMPAAFTSAYADRLNTVCAIEVKEARDRDPLRPGRVLLAPGGRQMIVEKGVSGSMVRVKDAHGGQIYHPSVDQLLESAARVFGAQALGVVLTGMGADGLEGARKLKSTGAKLWSQDEASCVVYGMPRAVEKAGLVDRVVSLDEIGTMLENLGREQ
ncbi:MAG: hypothetical protein OI74_05190 [Gammaproteobacteria bacterium (ex Lamellibrachia satsuma)]|nr:MAG: chemotaxis response regulator protein-glutamate methylesterase [Gammaproteobacteria bacterium (ex Lamellibrachia satsuma)]RRS34607.1 MAG: hypothetical protein OI74_05190 [Gammaproteobacteria bacterium (ex Lamellibrachia satsuma)]RRS37402.1 MAG: hypothetical protein NV67_01110 [Gammaproteobacteria bacterium (ex Lamellibrachia satsuma)]